MTPATGEDELFARLERAVESVFESLVHASDESGGGAGAEPRPTLSVELGVDFTGLLAGTVAVRCSVDAAPDLARRFVVLEPGDRIEELEGVLGECANTLTGALETTTVDAPGELQLGLPYKLSDGKDARAVAYRLQKGPVSVEIRLDPVDVDENEVAA